MNITMLKDRDNIIYPLLKNAKTAFLLFDQFDYFEHDNTISIEYSALYDFLAEDKQITFSNDDFIDHTTFARDFQKIAVVGQTKTVYYGRYKRYFSTDDIAKEQSKETLVYWKWMSPDNPDLIIWNDSNDFNLSKTICKEYKIDHQLLKGTYQIL